MYKIILIIFCIIIISFIIVGLYKYFLRPTLTPITTSPSTILLDDELKNKKVKELNAMLLNLTFDMDELKNKNRYSNFNIIEPFNIENIQNVEKFNKLNSMLNDVKGNLEKLSNVIIMEKVK